MLAGRGDPWVQFLDETHPVAALVALKDSLFVWSRLNNESKTALKVSICGKGFKLF